MLKLIFIAFIKYLPAMIANGVPVFIRKGTPIDRGKKFIDGRRVLGDGKTWEGLIIGSIFSISIGMVYYIILENKYLILYSLVLGIGALLGDIIASFIKRRLGIPRGAPLPVLDQVNFILGSTAVVKIFRVDELAFMTITLVDFIIILFIASILHVTTNYIAFKLGLKNVPW